MDFDIISPKSINELLKNVKRFQRNKFRFCAGGTDLLMELKKESENGLTVIHLAQLTDKQFTGVEKKKSVLKIGAMVTANSIIQDMFIKKNFSVLHQAAYLLASPQIRQVATVGGNLCTASPSGDIACALMALDAMCEIINEKGKKRIIPIQKFFTGVRKTALKKGELLYTTSIPANQKTAKNKFSRFIKIGTRKSMECSVVSLAYHIQTDDLGKILNAGVAIGSVAPTIRLVEEATFFLKGKNIFSLTQNEKEAFAKIVLHYASPISDIRATAWYRKQVLYNISKTIFEEISSNEN